MSAASEFRYDDLRRFFDLAFDRVLEHAESLGSDVNVTPELFQHAGHVDIIAGVVTTR